jgi:hypothetical protein
MKNNLLPFFLFSAHELFVRRMTYLPEKETIPEFTGRTDAMLQGSCVSW